MRIYNQSQSQKTATMGCLFFVLLNIGCYYDSLDTRLATIDPENRVTWLDTRLNDPFEPFRYEAAKELGRIGDERAVEPLIAALQCSDVHVRAYAARSLGELGDRRAVEPLIRSLKHDDYARGFAALALGELGDSRASEALTNIIEREEYWGRPEAAIALGKLHERRAIEQLKPLLVDDRGMVRMSAAIALGNIGDPSVIPFLVKTLDDGDWLDSNCKQFYCPVSATAAHALGRLNAVESLITALKHSNPTVREAAAFELGRIKDPAAIEALSEVTKDQDIFTREAAVEALGLIDDPRVLSVLEAARTDPNPMVSGAAIKALAVRSSHNKQSVGP